MQKTISLFFVAVFYTAFAYTQQPGSGDKIMFQGYLIRLNPASTSGYGYDIYYKDQIITHQSNNPFNFSPVGLSREDAFKVARWQILQWSGKPQEKDRRVQHNQHLPKSVAEQLHIPVP